MAPYKRLSNKAIQFLDMIAATGDAGSTASALIDGRAPKRTQEGQRQIINRLIQTGPVQDRNSPPTAEQFFKRQTRKDLVLTDFGREMLNATKAKVQQR